MNKDGEMEVVDIFTGEVIAVQKSREELLFGVEDGRVNKITLPSGKTAYIERTLGENPRITRYVYSELQAAAICTLLADGHTMRDIARKPGFPPIMVIRRWRIEHPEFEEQIQLAKKDRAEYFQEKVLDSVKDISDKDDAAVARVQVDAYKWAASVDDPDVFGTKTKISGDPSAPLTLLVDTGITRAPTQFIPARDVTPQSQELTSPGPVLPQSTLSGIVNPGVMIDALAKVDGVSEAQVCGDTDPPSEF